MRMNMDVVRCAVRCAVDFAALHEGLALFQHGCATGALLWKNSWLQSNLHNLLQISRYDKKEVPNSLSEMVKVRYRV